MIYRGFAIGENAPEEEPILRNTFLHQVLTQNPQPQDNTKVEAPLMRIENPRPSPQVEAAQAELKRLEQERRSLVSLPVKPSHLLLPIITRMRELQDFLEREALPQSIHAYPKNTGGGGTLIRRGEISNY